MATTHDVNCRCANCRALRAARHVETPPAPGKINMGLEDVKSEEEQLQELIESVRANPVAFAITAREEDVSHADIASTLTQAGYDIQEVGYITEQAEAYMKATRRRRGIKRILTGLAFGVGGAVVTGATIYFAGNSGFYLVTTGLFVAAGWYVLRGLWEMATG